MNEKKQVAKSETVNEIALPDPMQLLQTAVQNNFDIDKLKQLMDLQERWEKKEAKKSFLSALSRFQTIVPNLKKSKVAKVTMKTGGQFQYTYADLGIITKQIKQALNECGLSYRWEFAEDNSKMKVTCILSHIDGHSETTTMEGGLDNSGAKNDIQQKGSTHTYLQRYTLIGVLGLSTSDDDKDGNISKNKSANTGITQEEALEQWKQVLSEVKNKTHLHSLYLQNKSVVDQNANIQALFKEKQKTFTPTPKIEMP